MSDIAATPSPEQHLPTRQELRAELAALQAQMLAEPEQVEIEVMHHFSDGTYCRTVLMKAGDLVMGKIHKKEHIVIVSAGRALVVSEEFGAKEIVAPAVFKSPPGVKRALRILEDCVWTTVHKNASNTEDLAILEAELIADDYTGVSE